MPRLLVVLANASLCRFFMRDSGSRTLRPLTVLKHPASRLPGHALGSDRPGHEAVDRSSSGNRFEPRSDVRRQEHVGFAREIAAALQTRLAAGEYDDLWVLASKPFLGELKSALHDPVARHLRQALPIDLTGLGLAEIEARLQALHAGHDALE